MSDIHFFGSESAWFWTMLQFGAIALSLGFVIYQVWLLRQANMIQTITRMDDGWGTSVFTEHRRRMCADYKVDKLLIRNTEAAVLGFFENLGLYLRRRIVDRTLIWEKYSYYIEHYWMMFKPHVQEFRNAQKDVTGYDNFEYLYNEMCICARRHGVPYGQKPKAEIERFLASETALPGTD